MGDTLQKNLPGQPPTQANLLWWLTELWRALRGLRTTVTVVTAMRVDGGALQVKTRSVTVIAADAESDWHV